MQLWIWRDIRLPLPEDWEMLQFSKDPHFGRCTFADRHNYRVELSWRVVDGPPDFKRMISDCIARLREEGSRTAHRLAHGQWRGLGNEADGVTTTRFTRFFKKSSRLVELVFIWAPARNARLERDILDGVSEEPEHARGLRRWRAFGMDLLVSGGLELEACSVQPANVDMRFADEKGRAVERFARRGMVKLWLSRPLGEWLARWVPEEVKTISTGTVELAGHRVERLSGEVPAPGLSRVVRRRPRFDAAAWMCPVDGRLYSACRKGQSTTREVHLPLAGDRLSCCPDLKVRATG